MHLFLGIVLALVQEAGGRPARIVVHLDGSPLERALIEGRGLFLHQGARVQEGLGALQISPSSSRHYAGLTLLEVPAMKPQALTCQVFLGGSRPVTFRVRLDDRTHQGHALDHPRLHPGWNRLVIPLRGRRTHEGRPMDFQRGVHRFQLSTSVKALGGASFVVDAVAFLGEAPPAARQKAIARALAGAKQEGWRRVQILRDLARALPDKNLLALARDVQAKDPDESVRRFFREELARRSSPAVLQHLISGRRRAREDARLELDWILAALPNPEARKRARALLFRPATPVPEKVALLQGLALKNATDLLDLQKALGPKAPWPVQAAWAADLRLAGGREGVEGLLYLLASDLVPRVRQDCELDLVALTGRDLGPEVGPWRTWWAQAREHFDKTSRGPGTKAAYGRFFGLQLVDGRTVFVLDISGSMRDPVGGGLAARHISRAPYLSGHSIKTRLQLAQEELIHGLAGLSQLSRVGLVVYNDETLWLTRGLQELTQRLKTTLTRRVRALSANQYTNIYQGLFEAFHLPHRSQGQEWRSGPDTIFLVSDGNPSRGPITRHTELRDAVLRWNIGRAIKINTVNVGEANASMLRGMAEGTGGRFKDLHSSQAAKPRGKQP